MSPLFLLYLYAMKQISVGNASVKLIRNPIGLRNDLSCKLSCN